MHVNCSTEEVILMQEARYGRMKFGTCIKFNEDFMDCYRYISLHRSCIKFHIIFLFSYWTFSYWQPPINVLYACSDALAVLDKLCSGKRSCELVVIVAFLNFPNPCPEELRSYLEASFTCEPGELFVTKKYDICVFNMLRANFCTRNINMYLQSHWHDTGSWILSRVSPELASPT